MRDWLAELAGEQYVDAILWTSAALVALVVLLALVKIFRSLNSGTFVAGGRNRKTRLAVMDATAIDSQRRLVLIRRDDVEHLLLIGGPTDVVVEQDIRLMGQRRPAPVEAVRPAAESEDAPELPAPPAPRLAQPARPVPELSHPNVRPALDRQPPRPSPQPARPPAPTERAPEPRTPPLLRTPAPSPRVQAAIPTPTVRPAPRPALANGSERREAADNIDETLMNELDLTGEDLAGERPSAARPKQESSLDDEMARLLGELANPRR